ncbi:von Willebrand factor A domain-containing protein 1-like isoform X2 [Channa argus]|uniref:von Willebrand factor A domain-containing protein 1-like isoform X2 n=1 Tax=Channa argus TaxID=215402 RepID=UPI00351FAF74
MKCFLFGCIFLWATLQRSNMQIAVPATVLNCCEGDILILLDSSGSVANYDFSRMLLFVAELLRPFSLGRGHVRVGLLQVDTMPRKEFGLDVHSSQDRLQEALRRVNHLQGETNTEAALRMAQQMLTETQENVPKILLWLTDEIIRAERLRVVHLTSHSAVLQWHPVLNTDSSYYELWYNSVLATHPEIRRTLSFDSSSAELTNLQPDTTYSASLRPESNKMLFNTLTATFTTLPDVLSPAVVSVSDSGPHQIRVSWGPLQLAQVQRYTVEYGAIPSGRVQTVTLHGHMTSTLLTGLEPGTQYLVTVSALHVNGKERAMSVRACTHEAALPALDDLQLNPAGEQEVQVTWLANQEGLKGYWVSWEKENFHMSSPKTSVSSIYLPPTSRSVWLTNLTPSTRVCVSPIYSSGRGDGLCCTASHTGQLS